MPSLSRCTVTGGPGFDRDRRRRGRGDAPGDPTVERRVGGVEHRPDLDLAGPGIDTVAAAGRAELAGLDPAEDGAEVGRIGVDRRRRHV